MFVQQSFIHFHLGSLEICVSNMIVSLNLGFISFYINTSIYLHANAGDRKTRSRAFCSIKVWLTLTHVNVNSYVKMCNHYKDDKSLQITDNYADFQSKFHRFHLSMCMSKGWIIPWSSVNFVDEYSSTNLFSVTKTRR